jgi:hypothetical protein
MSEKPKRPMSFQTQKTLQQRLKHFPLVQKAKDGTVSPQELKRQLQAAGASFQEVQQIMSEYSRIRAE